MRFLVDEDLPRSVAALIRSYGHEALDVRDATARFIVRLLDEFLQQRSVITRLSGKLAIVEPGRVRLRG
jgi:hypothetical protein